MLESQRRIAPERFGADPGDIAPQRSQRGDKCVSERMRIGAARPVERGAQRDSRPGRRGEVGGQDLGQPIRIDRCIPACHLDDVSGGVRHRLATRPAEPSVLAGTIRG